MSAIKLIRPSKDAISVIEPKKGDSFVIAFDPSEVVMRQQDGSLVFVFEDGTEIVLANFYNVFGPDEMPEFVFEGTTFTAQEFFAMQGAENLLPEAGPKIKTGGGRFHEYDLAELNRGLDSEESGAGEPPAGLETAGPGEPFFLFDQLPSEASPCSLFSSANQNRISRRM